MSFSEILNELPHLKPEKLHEVIHNALALDNLPLSDSELSLVENRLNAYRMDPSSSLTLDEMKVRLHHRFNP